MINSVKDDRKSNIAECDCVFHRQEGIKNIGKSIKSFMAGMLCAETKFSDFKNPSISEMSRNISMGMLLFPVATILMMIVIFMNYCYLSTILRIHT